jgi:hypothetical protein
MNLVEICEYCDFQAFLKMGSDAAAERPLQQYNAQHNDQHSQSENLFPRVHVLKATIQHAPFVLSLSPAIVSHGTSHGSCLLREATKRDILIA